MRKIEILKRWLSELGTDTRSVVFSFRPSSALIGGIDYFLIAPSKEEFSRIRLEGEGKVIEIDVDRDGHDWIFDYSRGEQLLMKLDISDPSYFDKIDSAMKAIGI